MNSKRSFVLLRGLGREARHWGDFANLLGREDFCSKIFLCDLPGAGVFHRDPGADSIPKIVKHLVEKYHSDLLLHKPLTLVGMSFGGMVSLEFISQYPDLFSEYILINSSLGSLSPFHQRLRLSAIPTLLKIGIAGDRERKENYILSLISHAHQRNSEVRKQLTRIAETAPMKLSVLVQQLLAAARYKEPPKKIQIPGLVLYSKKDDLVNPDCSLALSRFLQAKKFAHEKAGHDLTLDDPQWVVDRLAEFLEGRP